MNMSSSELERAMSDVLSGAAQILPAESFEEARRYIDHNEFELALDTIAATLAEAEKRVDASLYANIVQLGNEMQMAPSFWERICPEG